MVSHSSEGGRGNLRHSERQSQSRASLSVEPMCLDPYRQSGMTWKVLHDCSVTSGRSWNRGDSRLTGFCDALRDSFGRCVPPGVEMPSLLAMPSLGDMLAERDPWLLLFCADVLLGSRSMLTPLGGTPSSIFTSSIFTVASASSSIKQVREPSVGRAREARDV